MLKNKKFFVCLLSAIRASFRFFFPLRKSFMRNQQNLCSGKKQSIACIKMGAKLALWKAVLADRMPALGAIR